MSRGVSGSLRELRENSGNKREQTATRCDMKRAKIENQALVFVWNVGGDRALE